jgi:hypothetical protein
MSTLLLIAASVSRDNLAACPTKLDDKLNLAQTGGM